MKKIKRLTFAVIFSFFLIATGLSSLVFFATAISPHPALPPQFEYDWGTDTHTSQVFHDWNDFSYVMNETGEITDAFNYSVGYAISADEWIEEDRVITFSSNYSYVSNVTLNGNYSMNLDLDVYRVNMSYKDTLEYIWFALKEGSYELEVNVDAIEWNYTFSNYNYKKSDITYRKYNMTTDALIATWNETVEETINWTSTPIYDFSDSMPLTVINRYNFTAPMVIMYYVYHNNKGEHIGWAEMFSDFIVYNDIDKNAIYSLGEQEIAPDMLGLHTSDEWCGSISPWAVEYYEYVKDPYGESTFNSHFPNDRIMDEFTAGIEFTTPTESGDVISWDIHYPNYPLNTEMNDQFSFNYGLDNVPYSLTSPINFSFGFDFLIDSWSSQLNMTTDISKMSSPTFYNELQGCSLAMPHYTYFLCSSGIEEEVNKILTLPTSTIDYKSGLGTRLAQIVLGEDKKSYTLHDYPTEGESRDFESVGSTSSKMILSSLEYIPFTPTMNRFIQIVYSLEDLNIITDDPQFDGAASLFNIEFQNFPVWSGEHLTHDPQFITYFDEQPEPDPDPTPGGGGTDLFFVIAVVGASVVIGSGVIVGVMVLLKKKRK